MGTPIELAKQSLDIGLYTDDAEASLGFYRDSLGLPYEELLRVAKGSRQHRLGLRGSVLKINETRDVLASSPTGFQRLVIADPTLEQPRQDVDPQGMVVERVLPGTDGISAIAVTMAVADVDGQLRFLADGLWGDLLGPVRAMTGIGPPRVRIGTTIVLVEHDPSAPRAELQRALGFRYVTIQIRDVLAAHRHLLKLGFEEGMAPIRLGETAAISFVRDPNGNWWEVSQRANLTGPLPSLETPTRPS